ncbi:MAG: translation initiation factor IF-6 [Candidatus Anstonellales archaeon]
MIFRHKSIEHIGLYAKASDEFVIAGNLNSTHFYSMLNKLSDKIVKIDIFGSPAITFFIACNKNGIVLPFFTEKYVLSTLKQELGLNIMIYEGKNTALGNVLSVNDKMCICSKYMEKKDLKRIEDTLGVETIQVDLGNYVTPGSLILLTNKGFCLSPLIKDKYDEIKSLLNISGEVVTCNTGSPFLHIGIIANSKAALVGFKTTGFEMGRIQMALDLVEQK